VGYIPFNQNNQKNVVTMSYFRKQRESQEGGPFNLPRESNYGNSITLGLKPFLFA
jgi:hypothetical protein